MNSHRQPQFRSRLSIAQTKSSFKILSRSSRRSLRILLHIAVLFSLLTGQFSSALNTVPSSWAGLDEQVYASSLEQGQAKTEKDKDKGEKEKEREANLAKLKKNSKAALARQPLVFEANAGQTDASVRFLSRTPGGTFFLTPGGFTLVLSEPVQPTNTGLKGGKSKAGKPAEITPQPLTDTTFIDHVVSVDFLGVNPKVAVFGGDQASSNVNYFFGADSSKWHSNINTFNKVTYTELYPGIDLSYDGSTGQIKGTYTVEAGVDPHLIKWKYNGVSGMVVDAEGNLQITPTPADAQRLGITVSSAVTITEQAPLSWQEINSERVLVDTKYAVGADGSVSFEFGDYDPSLPLIVDPYLGFSTYLGGTSDDLAVDVAVDGFGNAFVTGSTYMPYFQASPGAYPPSGVAWAVFVAVFTPAGARIYSTYFGGNDNTMPGGIDVDSQGNAYIGGNVYYGGLPMVGGYSTQFLADYFYGYDGFLIKLNNSGSSILYSTYIADGPSGGGVTSISDVSVDNWGMAYLAGSDFRFHTPEAFAHKINTLTTGASSFVYHHFIPGADYAYAIAANASGEAFVGGPADSTLNWYVTSDALQPNPLGGGDAFLARIASSGGGSPVYLSYFGASSGSEAISDIDVDLDGDIYVTGGTTSNNFANVPYNAAQPSNPDNNAAFAARFTNGGATQVYFTYIGGNGFDSGTGIAVDGNKEAYITGSTTSTNTLTINPYQATNKGGSDVFVAKVTSSGLGFQYFTYLGGTNADYGNGIAVSANGAAYVVGQTFSTAFPTLNAYQGARSGPSDAFVFSLGTNPPSVASTPQPEELRCGGSPSQRVAWKTAGFGVDTATGNFCYSTTEIAIPHQNQPLMFNATYNASMAAISDTLGYGWTHNYNMYIDRNASGHYLVHEETGTVAPFNSDLTAPKRVRATLSSDNNKLKFTRLQDQQVYYFEDINGSGVYRLKRIQSLDGPATNLVYQNNRLATATIEETGATLTFSYTNSLLTNVSGLGLSVSLAYTNNELRVLTDVGVKQTQFTYQTGHLLQTIKDPNNGIFTNSYNSSTRLIGQTDPMSRTMGFGYSGQGDVATTTRITDTLNLVTLHKYSSNTIQEVVSNPSSQPASWKYTYKPNTTWLATSTDPLTRTWTFEWDDKGNQTKVTDPLARTTQYGYDSIYANFPLQVVTDTLAHATTYFNDDLGHVRQVQRPWLEGGLQDGVNVLQKTTYAYRVMPPWILDSVTDPQQRTWSYTFDSRGYPQTNADPLMNTTTYTYTNIGLLQSVRDPNGNAASYAYNAYGDVLTATNSLGFMTNASYDPNRNLKTSRDENGRITVYEYNKNNELIQATRPDNLVEKYSYDNAGRVISHTNTLNLTTLTSYDDLNHKVTVTDTLGRPAYYTYDVVGNLRSVKDVAGRTATLNYDTAYQLQSVTYSDGTTPTVSFGYNALGLRSAMTDGLGVTTYKYDSLDRLTSVRDANARVITYTYNLDNSLYEIYYPDIGTGTRKVKYEYDAAARVNKVTDWANRTFGFGYDVSGNLKSIDRPGTAVDSTFDYDKQDQLLALNHTAPSLPSAFKADYQRDPKGLLTYTNESPSSAHAYSYDNLDRLTGDLFNSSTASKNTWNYDSNTRITQTSVTACPPVTDWITPASVSISGNTVTKTGGSNGWDAGAASSRVVASGDVSVQATGDRTDVYTQFGLGHTNANAGHDELDFSIRLADGIVQVFESATLRNSFGAYVAGDIFRVAVEGGVVKYYKNNVSFYSSTVAPTYPLRLDMSIATPGADIINAQMCAGDCSVTFNNASLTNAIANGNNLKKNGGQAYVFDGGTISNEQVSTGTVTLTTTAADNSSEVIVGLNHNNINAGPDDIDYGIWLSEGTLRVRERDDSYGPYGSYAAGDVFKETVSAGVVRYYRNDTIFYTSTLAVQYPLFVDSSLSDPQSSIKQVYMCAGPAPVSWTAATNVAITGNTIKKISGTQYAFDAGASSTQTVAAGNVYAEATVDNPGYDMIFGLGRNNTTASGADIDFGLYISSGSLKVSELGSWSSSLGSVNSGDVLRVAVVDGVVRYYKNGALLQTSSVTPTYPLRLDSSLADLNGRLLNAQLVASATTTTTTTRSYDNGDKLLTLVESFGNHKTRDLSFGYNTIGNRTVMTDTAVGASGKLTYSYDQVNRLTSFTRNSTTTTYGYDGDGLRLRKTKGGATEYFTWSTAGMLLQDGSAAYVYGPGGLLEEVTNTGSVPYYYHTDQLGSVRALSDSAGQVVASYDYDAYGKTISATGTITNPFRYTGEYTDVESGLIYLRARYYDPATQLFLTPDPAASGQPYAYVAGSPLNATDPSGMFPDWLPDALFIGADLLDIQQNGLNWGNGLALGADLILGPMPFAVAGVGALSRGARGAGHVADGLYLAEDLAARGRVADLLYGGRVGEGLPGSAGIAIARRPTVTELENLTVKHGVEFAVSYRRGPGRNGGGGQYFLHSGDYKSVGVGIDADVMLIYHTHPRGSRIASDADKLNMQRRIAAGSPQRSSTIIPVGRSPFRYGPDWP